MAAAATTDDTDHQKARTFRAPDVLWDAFKAACAHEGATPTEILRELMRGYVRADADRHVPELESLEWRRRTDVLEP